MYVGGTRGVQELLLYCQKHAKTSQLDLGLDVHLIVTSLTCMDTLFVRIVRLFCNFFFLVPETNGDSNFRL